MIYIPILEGVTIFAAFLIKLVAFYFLIKFFNRTIKFSTILKPILLYELGALLFILINPIGLFLYLPSIIGGILYLLTFIVALFLIFYFMMRKFSVLTLKQSLVVFLVIFFIITPSISFFRVTLLANSLKLPVVSEEASELRLLYGIEHQPLLFQIRVLPPSLKILKILNVINKSLLEEKFLNELRIFMIQYWLTLEETKPPEVETPEEVTIDKITNWKTYRNDWYGFEMKYPETWNAVIEEEWRILPVKEVITFGPTQPEPFFLIYVRVIDNAERLSLRDFYTDKDRIYEFCGKDSYTSPICWFPFEELQPAEKLVAGIKSSHFEEGIPDLAPIMRFTLIPKGDFIFEVVQLKSMKYSPTELREIFNQISSTFRFLE